MSLRYLFDPNKQFQDRNGVNNVGGFLRVYIDGTDDRAITYKDFNGTFNEADIMLDTDGRAVVIVDDSLTFRIEVYERDGALQWTVTHFTARGEGGGGGSSTAVSVEGTEDEIDVDENTQGGIKQFVLSLSSTIKNAISSLSANLSSIALAVNGKKDRQNPVFIESSNIKTVTNFSQDENGNVSIGFDDIAFPDWTSAINSAFLLCEQKDHKKNTLVGYESSNTYYPSIKAVVDFVNSALQNLGGNLITDNGNPFTSSSDLPSSTPYGGVDIADKDYAYVQGTGFAERWSATVTGSSVAWVNEYTINIPVFTPEQQAAIDSGVTAEMLGTFLTKTGDGSNVTAAFTAAGSRTNISTGEKLSVIFGKIAKWFSDLKAVAFSGSYSDLSNKPTIGSGTLTIQKNGTSVATFGANATSNVTVNIDVPTKTSELTNDSNFLTTSGNGSDVTAAFTAASSRSNIATGEKLSVLFGKIAKWFSDLKALAFKDKVADGDISGTISDSHIASASYWNGKQDSISDLSTIRTGAAAGATALQPSGNGSNLTTTFTTAGSRSNVATGETLATSLGKIAKWFSDLKAVAFSGSYSDLSNKPTIGSGTLTIQKNGTNVATFGANATSNATANIDVPTKTSELTNDSNFLTTSGNGSNVTSTFTKNASDTSGMTSGGKLSALFKAISDFFASLKSVAFSGSYNDLSNKPTIPEAAKNGVLTIKQNGTSKGTFSANQSSNTEINVTDTTYESKSAASGGTAVSLVTTGEKYNWNAKQAALPTSGTASGTYAININGNAATASAAAYANDAAHANSADSAVTSALAAAANKLSSTYGFADVPIFFNSNGTPSRCFSISNRQRSYTTITDNATGYAITHLITGSEHGAFYEGQPGSYFKYHVKLRNGTISIVYRWSSNWNTILSESKFNGRIIWSRLTGSSSSNVDVQDVEKYFSDYPTGSDMTIGSFDLSTQQSFQNITAQGLMIIDGYNNGVLLLGTRMMLKFDMCFIKSAGQNTSMQAVIDSELYVMGT